MVFDYRFRYQVHRDRSPQRTLFEYLASDQHPSFSQQEMVWVACRAFWLPFAQRASDQVSAEEIRQSAQNAVYQLQAHINYLRESFGLESPPLSVAVSHTALPEVPAPSVKTGGETGWEAVPTPDPNDDPFL